MNPATQTPLQVIILAAGKGKRMYSKIPKVLHQIGGKSLVEHVVDSARQLAPQSICMIYGHGGELVKNALSGQQLQWREQQLQLGTGHAVQQSLDLLSSGANALILYGDVPLLSSTTLQQLIDAKQHNAMAILTATVADPSGYGRIVRDSANNIMKIVEEKDADDSIRQISEINSGVMVLDADRLKNWLSKIGNDNAQGEYYLTDLVELAVQEGLKVESFIVSDEQEIAGVNNKQQLATLERAYQLRQAGVLMRDGVTLRDPARFDLRGTIEVGQDVVIDVNVIIEGHCKIGNNVIIGPNCVLKDVTIADDVQIFENCLLEKSHLEQACQIGPFARLRPDSKLEQGVKVGNFVEIKKSHIAQGSKVNHLSYIGDTEMGENVNIGAGTITCNYDGANKHLTIIGDQAFIGSNTALVAPIEIGKGATIGAGSTLSKNAEADKLTFTRASQKTLNGWQRPVKKNQS